MKKHLLLPICLFCFVACSVDPIEDELLESKISEFNSSSECENFTAVPNNSLTITKTEAVNIESRDEVSKLYLSLLEPGVPKDGTFNPTIWELIYSFQEASIGEFTTEYSITNGQCTSSAFLTVAVVSDKPGNQPCAPVNAGPDNSFSLTESEAAALESWDEVRKLYLSLLAPGVDKNGTFNPSIWDLINRFQVDRVGEYSTRYTIGEGDCTDSVNLTIIVIPDGQSVPPCTLNAGPHNSLTITESFVSSIESWDEVRKLYMSLLAPGVSNEGTFDPTIWELINRFQIEGAGIYTTTYTVTEGSCTDTVQLSVIVTPEDQQTPPCTTVNAGPDNSMTITEAEAAAIPSWDEVRKLYLSLLLGGVSRQGTFDPSIWDLINIFQHERKETYITTYTIGEGECKDSVDLTIIVI